MSFFAVDNLRTPHINSYIAAHISNNLNWHKIGCQIIQDINPLQVFGSESGFSIFWRLIREMFFFSKKFLSHKYPSLDREK